MTTRTRLFASAAFGLATIASSHAATITEAPVPIRTDSYTGQAELTLPAFDEALGTITGLSVTVSAVLTESMILATLSGGPIPSTGAFSIHTSLWFPPTGSIRVDPWTVSAPIGRDGRGNAQAIITAGFTGAFELPNPGPGFATGPGPGPVVFYDLYASPMDLYSPGDGLHNISVAGSATATYTYVPVPVPESSTMTLVLSFLGIGLVAWVIAPRSAGTPCGRRGMFQ